MGDIAASIAGRTQVLRTVHMGEDPETIYNEAHDAPNSDGGGYLKYPPDPASGVAIHNSTAQKGMTRCIVFFNTNGIVNEDQMLFLWNSRGVSPGWYGGDDGGEEYLSILNGNGADPDFDVEIYGWMRGRFSSGYYITEKKFNTMPYQQWRSLIIPKEHLNLTGYTVLIAVCKCDYYLASYPPPYGIAGAPLMMHTAYLKPVSEYSSGYIWVEGTKFAYLDAHRTKRVTEGTKEGATGQTAGHLWVEGTKWRYIDSSGDERYIEGTLTGLSGKLASQISINTVQGGTKFCYIDDTGAERCFEGT